ncbi:aldehyde dehydrogenase family protein [Elizabethkingia sp. JS20170427COW]|uniref:aldehyde dehydrogenase family protein n=1 Tax=Elizabethkingia sp. JS20170427COW TaxID=2583851 RepID=UPI0011104AE2|nr:aldehyde dehydrogenase family protein [Elizabethkingia sp. JS20170427COW]QCX53380.1 aldehyde dehydrogenase family protein [Elizabethkingia sp. JS20170427COW]
MLSVNQIETKINKANLSFIEWKKNPFTQRQKLFSKLASLMESKTEKLASIITTEMNKPISQSIAEIEKCILMIKYYAEGEDVLKVEKVSTSFGVSEIHHSPMGIILGVMPWNYPFWQALRFAVPTILAGNTVVLKHASICFGTGNAIEKLFEESGFPKGVFQNLEVGHAAVEGILENPLVKGVSLTGSEPAGASVASIAGKNIKKSVLELGGSDAFIVLEDADFDKAAHVGALARLQNCGQTCIAAKRFIIHHKAESSFLPKFIEEYKQYTSGNAMHKDTKLSGMARKDLADDLVKQYQLALDYGAEVLLPLERIDDIRFVPGLIKVSIGNPILDEELFGPLGMVMIGKNDKECLSLANATRYGLGNSVWTRDREKAFYFAENLESGAVAINEMTKSMPELPFGGAKHSGYGTELSMFAVKEFTIPKSIVGTL